MESEFFTPIEAVVNEMTLRRYEHLPMEEACKEASKVIFGDFLDYCTLDEEKIWNEAKEYQLVKVLMKRHGDV